MIKAELVAEVSKTANVKAGVALRVIECTMGVIKNEIINGNNVYLRGFGTFQSKERAQKIGRNISKNTPVVIPAHRIPAFKAGRDFKIATQKASM